MNAPQGFPREAAPTPALKAERPERAVAARRPEILLSRSRRFCATCQVRKTVWLVVWGSYKNRRCWRCLTDEERAAFREGY